VLVGTLVECIEDVKANRPSGMLTAWILLG